jgi:hypothetical protein
VRHEGCSGRLMRNALWRDVELDDLFRSLSMVVDDETLRGAIDTAWSVYRTRRHEVDAADSRRCLLERQHGRPEARGDDAAELTAFGIAYPEWLPEDEC